MSKYTVKVGTQFDGELIVEIDESPRSNFRKAISITVIIAVAMTLCGAAIYGYFTGDFSALETIAQYLKDVVVTMVDKGINGA